MRDEHLFDLPEALFKMTALPAWRLGLAGKGVLSPGRDADLVVFDPDTIADTAGYGRESCGDPPVGLHLVFVGGVLTVRDGMYVGAMAGRAAAPPSPIHKEPLRRPRRLQ